MINEQRYGRNGVSIDVFSILAALLAQLLIELDEEQSLVLYVRKEVLSQMRSKTFGRRNRRKYGSALLGWRLSV